MKASEIIGGIDSILNVGGGANYIQLHEGLGLIGQVIDSVMGFIIVVLLVGIPIVVSLELLFINIPIFQDSVNRLASKHDAANKIIGVCFRDAMISIELANTVQTGKTANQVYLGVKIKTVFVAFVIIGVLLGPGNMIITFLAERIQDVLNLIS